MFVAIAALLSIGAQAGVAAADAHPAQQATIGNPTPALGNVHKGALPVDLSPAQRTALLKQASAATGDTARELGLGAKEKLVVRDVVKDADGTLHTRYERTYDGLPVLGGDLVVDSTGAGAAKGITPAVRTHLGTVDTTATVKPATAQKQALSAAAAKGAEKAGADRAPRKVVWLAQGSPVLAYETVVGGLQDDGTPNQLHVITDASTGKQLYSYQGIETGTGNTEYSGTVTLGTQHSGSTYTLTDTGRGNHKTYNLAGRTSGTGTLYSGTDDVWGNGQATNSETAAADAHYGAALTWDYYKNVHGRTGIRGDGVGAYSRVHYGNQYVNAFWDDSCFCMTYGDGFGNTSPLTSIDVAAHEMSHGVTSATAGLNYSGESGGLNEATSDIFATAVEFYANNSADPGDYLIGEKIDINGDGTPLRYQDKPSRDGTSPDNWSSGLGGLDVHYSSGPANHFFYLLSEGSGAKDIGGVHYDSPTGDGLPVTGIGRDKAALIWYKALTTKFTSTTNYAAARTGTLAVAGELYGTGSAEYKSVADAWAGIKVGSRPGGGDPGDPGDGTTFESNTRVNIPDRGTGTSSIAVSGISGNAPSDLTVSVDIVHTYRGDLVVDLVAPNGAYARLKDADGFDSGQNVQETYTVDASTVAANGTWKLRVQDTAAQDTGYINGWKLTF
nr:M4 family metallopeptidase [Streptomyces sp. TS71-3]